MTVATNDNASAVALSKLVPELKRDEAFQQRFNVHRTPP